MTKEPKLDRARRLLPEWSEYDKEARDLFNEWRSNRGATPPNEPSPIATRAVKDEL